MLKVFHADRLARLAQESHPREPIQRRLVIDKTAKRVRLLLAQILWDPKLTHWLHNALCDNLPREYMAIYLDVLQTLRKKVPELIDKLLAGRVHPEQYGSCTKEGFRLLMKRRWDPTMPEYLHAPKIVSIATCRTSSCLKQQQHFSLLITEKTAQQPVHYFDAIGASGQCPIK